MSGGYGVPVATVCRRGRRDGVGGADVVSARADQVGAHPAVAGERGAGVPVPGDGLVPLRALQCLLRGIVSPGHLERPGDLVVVAGAQAGEQRRVELVLAVVPGSLDRGSPVSRRMSRTCPARACHCGCISAAASRGIARTAPMTATVLYNPDNELAAGVLMPGVGQAATV